MAAGVWGKRRQLLGLAALLTWLSAPAALAKRSPVIVITDQNWGEMLQGEWMIEFYAPWCPACQQLQSEWSEFAEWSEDLGINVAKVDVTEQPGLSGRFIITALPTIYHCKDGEFRKYQGPRMKNDFLDFIDGKKWETIEPVSSWFRPSSFMMASMSALFQLSMWIRHCHNYFTEDLGIPVWGSYSIFALATLFSGLVLGLILVFVADCMLPSRRFKYQPHCSQKKTPGPKLLKPNDEPLENENPYPRTNVSNRKVFEKSHMQEAGDYSPRTLRKRGADDS
ncbi:thioredoxin-related transmembrane protein 1 [Callorhinchus milii]|nr:thioredoxin-related transmembrane protein 1 [Callorhinchus milii]|eukprot:gi/632942365/ref/XP_007886373.1/ PREDICTED: thioredoxin-related transmembrane protein 1 [Callorhinchus milii]